MKFGKILNGWENMYQISNLGRVKSLNYNRTGKEQIIKSHKRKDGYVQVCLCRNKKITTYKLHRLVAETFLENPNNLPCVNHKDENKENNQISNLEWCDKVYNINYRYAKL